MSAVHAMSDINLASLFVKLTRESDRSDAWWAAFKEVIRRLNGFNYMWFFRLIKKLRVPTEE